MGRGPQKEPAWERGINHSYRTKALNCRGSFKRCAIAIHRKKKTGKEREHDHNFANITKMWTDV